MVHPVAIFTILVHILPIEIDNLIGCVEHQALADEPEICIFVYLILCMSSPGSWPGGPSCQSSALRATVKMIIIG